MFAGYQAATRRAAARRPRTAKRLYRGGAYGPLGFRAPRRVGVQGVVLATRGFRGGYGKSAAERKVSDIAVATYQVNTTGSFTLLHVPQLGTDYTQRVGRKTLIKSLYIRGRVATETSISLAAVTNGSQMARMIVFLDLQPNGAAPAVTDLLNTAAPESMLNLNNRDRFKIIKDKQWVFDPYVNVTTATQSQYGAPRQTYPLKVFKKCNYEVIFNAVNGGTISDINSGALYMFFIGSSPAGANTDVNAIVGTRIRFTDN